MVVRKNTCIMCVTRPSIELSVVLVHDDQIENTSECDAKSLRNGGNIYTRFLVCLRNRIAM
jgi:hypothetical protein